MSSDHADSHQPRVAQMDDRLVTLAVQMTQIQRDDGERRKHEVHAAHSNFGRKLGDYNT